MVAHADPRALGQVLLNLRSNGVKYNREQGALWVEVRSAGAEVAISVGDEGLGLTAEQRCKLFQPFDRLGAEDGKVAGSGLGLVISKQLIEAMQGRLEVHDQPHGGCRFKVWLPASPAPGGETEGPAGATNRAQPKAELPLMLCVDDNPVNPLLLQEIIEIIGGCRLLLAPDGESALEMAQRHRPNVMVSDPGLGQPAVARLSEPMHLTPAATLGGVHRRVGAGQALIGRLGASAEVRHAGAAGQGKGLSAKADRSALSLRDQRSNALTVDGDRLNWLANPASSICCKRQKEACPDHRLRCENTRFQHGQNGGLQREFCAFAGSIFPTDVMQTVAYIRASLDDPGSQTARGHHNTPGPWLHPIHCTWQEQTPCTQPA